MPSTTDGMEMSTESQEKKDGGAEKVFKIIMTKPYRFELSEPQKNKQRNPLLDISKSKLKTTT